MSQGRGDLPGVAAMARVRSSSSRLLPPGGARPPGSAAGLDADDQVVERPAGRLVRDLVVERLPTIALPSGEVVVIVRTPGARSSVCSARR